MHRFGVTTRAQLLAGGMSASTIDYRCRQGIYHRLMPGIYCTEEPTALARCAAIVAWLPDAVLSHRTAAWLRGWITAEPTVFEVTVPKNRHRNTPAWLKLYRRNLPPHATDECWSLPTTDAAQTLFDCVAVLNKAEAEALVDQQLGQLVSAEELLARCGQNGSTQIRQQVRKAAVNYASEAERRFARAMAERSIVLAANKRVGPYVCDFVDEPSKTIIEVDGREFHIEHDVFITDRRKQNWLVLEGWLLLRYAAFDIFKRLDICADEAARVIRRRRHSHWRPRD